MVQMVQMVQTLVLRQAQELGTAALIRAAAREAAANRLSRSSNRLVSVADEQHLTALLTNQTSTLTIV